MEVMTCLNAFYKEKEKPAMPLLCIFFSVLPNTASKFSYLLYYKFLSPKKIWMINCIMCLWTTKLKFDGAGKKVKLILITLLFQFKRTSFQCSKNLAIKNRLLTLQRTWILRFALEKIIIIFLSTIWLEGTLALGSIILNTSFRDFETF